MVLFNILEYEGYDFVQVIMNKIKQNNLIKLHFKRLIGIINIAKI